MEGAWVWGGWECARGCVPFVWVVGGVCGMGRRASGPGNPWQTNAGARALEKASCPNPLPAKRARARAHSTPRRIPPPFSPVYPVVDGQADPDHERLRLLLLLQAAWAGLLLLLQWKARRRRSIIACVGRRSSRGCNKVPAMPPCGRRRDAASAPRAAGGERAAPASVARRRWRRRCRRGERWRGLHVSDLRGRRTRPGRRTGR